jgi:hypothetical protein
MKYLLMLFTSILFAQLPSSGQLAASMINTELGRASNTANSTLVQLGGLARSGTTPYNNRNTPKISDWYGYKHSISYYSYNVNVNYYSQWQLSCQDSGDSVTMYSPSSTVTSGMILYTNSNLTTPFWGVRNSYYKIYPQNNASQTYSSLIGGNGTVSDLHICSASDTTPPNPPNWVSGYNSFGYDITVEWSGASDNVGVTGYEVYRDGYLAYLLSGSELIYVDFNVCGGQHVYTVAAVDAAGNRSALSYGVNVDSFNPDQCW